MNISHGHYKKVCKECGIIINQCRCIAEKTVIEVTCDECKVAVVKTMPDVKQQLREALAREVYLRYQLQQSTLRLDEVLEREKERQKNEG